MDNINLIIFAWLMGITIYIISNDLKKRRKKHRYKLVFNIHHHKTHHQMAIVTSLTLTSLVAKTLSLTVVDKNNNDSVIPGTLSGLSVSSADSTQDTIVPSSPGSQDSVDVDAVTSAGGTTVTATAHFASTKMLSDGTTPAVQGDFTATLTLVNNVVVSAALVFNQ